MTVENWQEITCNKGLSPDVNQGSSSLTSRPPWHPGTAVKSVLLIEGRPILNASLNLIPLIKATWVVQFMVSTFVRGELQFIPGQCVNILVIINSAVCCSYVTNQSGNYLVVVVERCIQRSRRLKHGGGETLIITLFTFEGSSRVSFCSLVLPHRSRSILMRP